MKIYYKTKEIDYVKTLGELTLGEQIVISTADYDLENIRTSVSRVARRFTGDRLFTVNKSPEGAVITRTA